MSQENFQAKNVIDEMRPIFREENLLYTLYKDIGSPVEQQSLHSSVSFNHNRSTIKLQRPIESTSEAGLTPLWKSNGLLIISLIMRFAYQLKLKTESMKYKLLTRKIYSFIGDKSERYRQNLYHKKARSKIKLQLSAFKKYIRSLLLSLSAAFPTLRPDSRFVRLYQTLMIFCIVINLFYTPINLSFLNETENAFFQLFPLIVQSLWMLVHFNISYYEDQTLKTSREDIALHYCKSFLLMDFLIVFPHYFQNILGNYAEFTFILKIFQLRRLQDSFEYNTHFKEHIGPIIDLIKLIITLLFTTHCCACSWHFLGVFQRDFLGSENNWLSYYELGSLPWLERYVTSLYFSVITTLTVGYGDITPKSKWEQLFVILVAMNLCGLLGYTVTQIGEIFQTLNEKKHLIKIQMKAIEKLIKQRKLDDQLSIKVRKYFQYLIKQEQEENNLGEQLMKNISRNPALEEEVMIGTYKQLLSKSKLLKQIKESTLERLCTKVELNKLSPGDEIAKSGQLANHLIFIISGLVNVYAMNESKQVILKQRKEGDVIGEQEFIEQGFYTYTLQSQGYTRLAVISRSAFYEMLGQDQEDFEKICQLRDQCLFSFNKKNIVGCACEICGWTHGYIQCPFTFYQVNRQKILKELTMSLQQQRGVALRRCLKRQTFKDYLRIQQCQEDIVYNNKLFDDKQDQAEISSFEYGYTLQIGQEQDQVLQQPSIEDSLTSEKQDTIEDRQSSQQVGANMLISKAFNNSQRLIQVNNPTPKRSPFKKQSLIMEKKKDDDQIKTQLAELLQRLQQSSAHLLDKQLDRLNTNNMANAQMQQSADLRDVSRASVDQDFEVLQQYKCYYPQFNIEKVQRLLNVKLEKPRSRQSPTRNTISSYIRKRKMTKLRRVNFDDTT